jgi:hypothetical protein
MSESDTILVQAVPAMTRRGAPKELKVEVLAENVSIFMQQIDAMLAKAPDEVGGKFKLAELTVTAEVSAKGALVLMGTGVETEAKGGLTFKFVRK